MKLSEIQLGTEYAVIPSWTYNSRSARDVSQVRENDVVKASIISKEKYEYQASIRDRDPNAFKLAPQGSRSVGVLVAAQDSNGDTIYWTSRLVDIIAPYADLEPRWTVEKAQAEAKEKEYEAKQNRVRELRRQVDEELNRATNSITATVKELLGENTHVAVRSEGYDMEYKGVVTITISEFEQLVELAYAGKDNY